MPKNLLPNYLSRAQIREFLAYILDNGTDQIVESPDSTTHDAPMNIQIGAAVNSIKTYHVERRLNDMREGERLRLRQLECVFIEDDVKPEAPEGSRSVGIFYMTKKSEHQGDADTLPDGQHLGDIGDVAWLDSTNWEAVELGKTGVAPHHRLFVFWKMS